MNIAIPISDGKLSAHFGHADLFRFYDVDVQTQKILKQIDIAPPPHEPGVIPNWIAEQEVNILMVSGVGQKAINILNRLSVQVISGIINSNPDEIITEFLKGTLMQSGNSCNH